MNLDDLFNLKQTIWTQQSAIELCKKIEAVCPPYGFHVALTGGTLYKEGVRKDCDILFYRIRQIKLDSVDTEGLFTALKKIGVYRMSGQGWCHKALHIDHATVKKIDLFFPESLGGEYVPR